MHKASPVELRTSIALTVRKLRVELETAKIKTQRAA